MGRVTFAPTFPAGFAVTQALQEFLCSYPLTGDVSIIPGAIPMTVTGADMQTASYTTQATGTEYNAYALPSGFATFSLTSGVRQWGWTGISVPLVGTSTSLAYLVLKATDASGVNRLQVSLSSLYSGSLKCRMIVTDSDSVTTTVDTATTPSAVWIVQDCDAGTARVFADYGAGPVEITLTGDAMTAGTTSLFCYVQQLAAMPAEYEAQTMGATLVTVASSMPEILTTAVTDPCGNAVGTAFDPYFLYDFTTQLTVPTGYTYIRNSAKRVWSPSQEQYVALAANEYAPDYDPLTGLCRGFRSETAATNLLLWSSDFSNAAWAVDTASKGSATGSLIAGGTAQSVTQSGAGGFIYQDVGTFTGASHTAQVLVEQGAGAVVTRLTMRNTTDGADVGSVSLTWATGAVAASGSGTAVGFKRRALGPNGGEVYLVALSGFTGTAGKNRQVRIIPDTTASDAAVYLHHAQLVSSTRVSSPIVTGAATAARQADIMSMNTLPAWFNQAQYTMFAEVELEQAVASDGRIISVSDGGSANRDMLYATGSGTFSRLVTASSVTQAATSVLGNATGITRMASSLSANQARHAVKGTAAAEDTSVTMPSVSVASIGSYGSSVQLDGWIRRIGIAPITRTTAELQAMTV